MRIILLLIALMIIGIGGAFAGLRYWPLSDDVSFTVQQGDVKRGAYMARLSGCVACHTAEGGDALSGGVELTSRFGTFVSPNITPDPEFGIGDWTYDAFVRAIRQGISPEGHAYYPAFPYEFYGALTDKDMADIWAALQSLPPSSNQPATHGVGFPFNIRDGLKPWRTFFSREFVNSSDSSRSARWNRGRYIVEGPAHCAACHTPRNIAGGLNQSAALQGDPNMLDGGRSPSITPQALRDNGWTVQNLTAALQNGVKPNGDVFGGSMAEIVRDGTSYLLSDHLEDMAIYLLDEDQ